MGKTSRSSRFLELFTKRLHAEKPTSECHWLPQELVLHVMRYLAADVHREHHAAYQHWQSEDEWTEWLKKEEKSVRALYASILVCKTWYTIGVEVLYANPTFVTKSQLRSFTLTVEKSHTLSRLVKSLSIAELYYPRFKIELFGIMDKHRERLNHYVQRALVACSFVTSLDLCTDSELGNMVGTILSERLPSISVQLRRLTIRGVCFHSCFSQLDLPHLEVLSISQYYHIDLIVFPHLPRLHTLQVIASNLQSSVGSLEMDITKFPSLRVLQIYDNEFEYPIFDAESPPYFSKLDRVEIYGSEEMHNFDVVNKSIMFSDVRELVVGPITAYTSWLPNWRPPLSVESMTLVIDLQTPGARELGDEVLQNVLQFLSAYPQQPSNTSRLCRLRLAVQDAQYELLASEENLFVSSALERLENHCLAVPISFDIDPIGAFHWLCTLFPPLSAL